jgi:hypothetical protein
MTWLTDEERAENSRKDKEAQKLGFSSHYDMEKSRKLDFQKSKLNDLKNRKSISDDDIRFIIECYNDRLIYVGL